jgi:hemerythrin superfamily protein
VDHKLAETLLEGVSHILLETLGDKANQRIPEIRDVLVNHNGAENRWPTVRLT